MKMDGGYKRDSRGIVYVWGIFLEWTLKIKRARAAGGRVSARSTPSRTGSGVVDIRVTSMSQLMSEGSMHACMCHR